MPPRCRHAFDADHIAAIDNTTRKLVADGQRPVTIGLSFSLGHSTVAFVMALFVAVGATLVGAPVSGDSTMHQTPWSSAPRSLVVFLIIIGLINLPPWPAFTGVGARRRPAPTTNTPWRRP